MENRTWTGAAMFPCWMTQIMIGGDEGIITGSSHPDWEGQGGFLEEGEAEVTTKGQETASPKEKVRSEGVQKKERANDNGLGK